MAIVISEVFLSTVGLLQVVVVMLPASCRLRADWGEELRRVSGRLSSSRPPSPLTHVQLSGILETRPWNQRHVVIAASVTETQGMEMETFPLYQHPVI